MSEETDDIRRQVAAAERMLRLKKARVDMLEFTKLTMPDPASPDDIDASKYEPAKHHEVIAAALEEVEAGRMLRLIITMPPRHGKSELASKRFPAWFIGKDPSREVILATYNANFAQDFGRKVRDIIEMKVFGQIFPGSTLKNKAKAADRLEMDENGLAHFVGTGGSLTGRGADCLIIDDAIKSRVDANSKSFRDKQWEWFTQVAMTRLLPMGRVVIIMTRWHEDDLVGRLTDPSNPCYNRDEAAVWKVLSLPAIADEGDPMGRKNGEALWPERYPLPVLEAQRRLDPTGFSALYQGKPTPDDGDYFTREMLVGYRPGEMPDNLRWYAASDHAVATTQDADKTCMGCVGVDEDGDVWIPPDIFWRRARTDVVVDGMLDQMERHRPIWWWAERGHISKAIGPFLRKRMQERNIYCAIDEVVPAKDKQTRAQAIRGRMAMGKVHFPKFASWWGDAEAELLKFPAARHDDFVDWLAHIGMGLAKTISAQPETLKDTGPKTGTLAWIKRSSQSILDKENRLKSFWS